MTSLKPFFSFYGSKWRSVPRYPAPRFSTIVEPFAGSAGYSLRYPDSLVILVERDPKIASVWRYLIGARSSEIAALPLIRVNETVDDLGVCQEARWLIGFWLNKGSAGPCRSPSAWMRKGTHTDSFWGESVRCRIARQVGAIKHWTLIEGDYSRAPDIEATWFVDPPYQAAGRHYRYSSKDIDFLALGQWCRERIGQAIVCESEGADWLPFRHFADIKANESRHGGKVSREAIWTKGCLAQEVLPL